MERQWPKIGLAVDSIDEEMYLYLVDRNHYEAFGLILHLPVKKETKLEAWLCAWESSMPHETVITGLVKSTVDIGGYSTSIVPFLETDLGVDPTIW